MEAENTLDTLTAGGRTYRYYSLAAAERLGYAGVSRLPYVLRVVLENVLRQSASGGGCEGDPAAVMSWLDAGPRAGGIRFRPVRVMMDDTAGLPLIGDLAAMRDAVREAGGDPGCIDPAIPVDFIVDHSVIADHTGSADALARNMALELERNAERYRFLRWGAEAFGKLRVVPPGRGICHQINLEHLARVVWTHEEDGEPWAYPDSLVGIDSHTPMINALGIVGWGVSGMEGVSAALGEPVPLLLPEVVGCRLGGALPAGVTATDLVLSLTQHLRRHGVIGKLIEYWGAGLDSLTLQDRATVANMTPEAGATMSFFPIDAETLRYLRSTGRDPPHVALVEAYAKAQGLWRDERSAMPKYSEILDFDLGAVEPSLSGPKLPHNRVRLSEAPQAYGAAYRVSSYTAADAPVKSGDVVIAAITSCTNTSNPALMVGAGLLARNAVRRGLRTKPWVKTSLSPGSRVVADYLAKSGLQHSLDALGFHVAGFGCMTCVGFSGPLAPEIASAIEDRELAPVAVLSGNRNYEGRAHPLVRASFLASPPLVVAYALAGSILTDLAVEPLGADESGSPVYLRDIWPDAREIRDVIDEVIEPGLYVRSYADVFEGGAAWPRMGARRGACFTWDPASTFIRRPQQFESAGTGPAAIGNIRNARILAMYGDMVTTEHVSPMGVIPNESPAARYLQTLGIAERDFVSYAARRLNHDVMVRGTFASPHLVNELTPGMPGGHTVHMPDGKRMFIFDAAERYRRDAVPLVIVAGRTYGAGSSRDWSAKGPRLLGVRAVIAESFERIHRSNLVAAGVLPLQFTNGDDRNTVGLGGDVCLDISGLEDALEPRMRVSCWVKRADGFRTETQLIARLDTVQEVESFRHGGLLSYLLRSRLSVPPGAGVLSAAPRGGNAI